MSDKESRHNREKQLSPYRNVDDIMPILSKVSIFAGLSGKQLYSLFRLLEKACYKEGEKIFIEGQQPSHIYIVKSGGVKLIANAEKTPLELIVFEEGQCFGETSVIGIQPHAATAVSVKDTELIVLSRNALLSLLKIDLELFSILILNIAREACRRLHKTDEILMHYVLKE
ncbi:MAG: cyclic nucleotide-binding domain-containing protein [Sedimentisphaerales bacterium]|nr:cyclic nucleotide-binding domain-containing protein [Sedimentisphaerales bacterium]